jgi:hypothetical protein
MPIPASVAIAFDAVGNVVEARRGFDGAGRRRRHAVQEEVEPGLPLARRSHAIEQSVVLVAILLQIPQES